MKRDITEQELMAKLTALGDISDEQRNEVTCALIGHSKIQTYCFGYYNCARCGAQVGDSLGGFYPQASEVVVVGHMGGNCPTCRANYETLTWQDKIFCPDPFAVKEDKPHEA
jgi:hypothetical protein